LIADDIDIAQHSLRFGDLRLPPFNELRRNGAERIIN
jgi:hypothetical protein